VLIHYHAIDQFTHTRDTRSYHDFGCLLFSFGEQAIGIWIIAILGIPKLMTAGFFWSRVYINHRRSKQSECADRDEFASGKGPRFRIYLTIYLYLYIYTLWWSNMVCWKTLRLVPCFSCNELLRAGIVQLARELFTEG
jgi:hypothetical protein